MRTWFRASLGLMFGLLLTSGSVAVPARADVVEPEVAESGSLIVIADTAEVRDGPSPDSDVITVVGKGEIFTKLGRTGAWYSIRINGDAFGWISGRAVSRFQAGGALSPPVGPEEEPEPYAGPYDSRYYLYYPGGAYDFSYYAWGEPYVSWEWYVYGSGSPRYRSWDHDRDYRRDRDHDRSREENWWTDEQRRRDDDRHEDDDVHGGNRSHRERATGRRSPPPPRPFGPRIRPPFMRR